MAATCNHNLTELESMVLLAIYNSDYHDGRSVINSSVWSITAYDVDMTAKSLSGAVASCSKKEFVFVQNEKNKADSTMHLTYLGYRMLVDGKFINDEYKVEENDENVNLVFNAIIEKTGKTLTHNEMLSITLNCYKTNHFSKLANDIAHSTQINASIDFEQLNDCINAITIEY